MLPHWIFGFIPARLAWPTAFAASLLLAGQVLAAPSQVGIRALSYIDTEFEPGGTRFLFTDLQNRAWVGELDPATGQCITATCRDVLLASNVLVQIKDFINGPEWGVSDAGPAVYLTTSTESNVAQSWRVNPDGSGLTRLTSDPRGTWGGLASVAPSAHSVRVIASSGTFDDLTGVWFDEDDGVLHPLPGIWLRGGGGRFLPGSARYAIYPYRSWLSDTQLAIIDTDLQTGEIVTTTPGQKSQLWGFAWNGALHVAAVTDDTAIEVFKSGPTPWPKVAALTPPVPGYLYSMEPLGNSGCFVTLIRNTNDKNWTDASIYVACINGSWTRVDDRVPMVRRTEPEPWWSGSQWFIYYNVTHAGLWVTDPILPARRGLLE